ncbi:MAG: sn-glycerol-3-phosphate ABC transporter ATP-binding protein UgpC [Rhodobacteraceae bacterium]|nr:sn-glycerol-3-phosphate ABC transporter ATP-binding protein UgpC [Paracoccaceae bacterium]
MSGVALKSIYKNYGDVEVIHGVDLEIDPGELCVFVGPSGCGKSTLLRMIAGLEQVTQGSVHIGQRDVTHVDAADRGIAMVFQTYALYPHMTVAQNLGFGLKMNKVPKPEIDTKVKEAAEILKLTDYMARKPKALSGGQRQRVAIGRAIVRGPEVFLFDEPLSNLDAELRVEMRVEIARLHKEMEVTMVYVTHDQVEAMTLADKIVVLKDGVVEQVGTPMDLYNNPSNKFVAGFIGSPGMNFLEGIVTDNGLQVNALGHKILQPNINLPKVGTLVTVGLRPQDLAIQPADSDILTELSEKLGGVTYDYLETPTGERIVVETKGEGQTSPQTPVEVNFDEQSIYLFDKQTENRIL